MTKKSLIIWGSVAILAVAIGGYFLTQRGLAVTAASATVGEIETRVTGTGKLGDPAAVEIFVPTAGTLAEVLVVDGQSVKTGDVLAKMDRKPLEIALARAQSQLAAAYALPNSDSQGRNVRWRTIQAAEAARDEAQANLDRSTLTAPKAGIVQIPTETRAGGTVTPSRPAFAIFGGSLTFTAQIDETDIVGVQRDQAASILLDAFPEAFLGKITAIRPTPVTTATGGVAYPVEISFTPGPARVFVGMSGNATIVTAKLVDALIVPAPAVWTDKDGRYVYRIENGAARKTPVKIGAANDTLIQITSGLAAGDQVATSQIAELTDGAKVHV